MLHQSIFFMFSPATHAEKLMLVSYYKTRIDTAPKTQQGQEIKTWLGLQTLESEVSWLIYFSWSTTVLNDIR